jgi:cytochrome P450
VRTSTASASASNAVWYFDQNPRQLDDLRGEPELLSGAVEELLRYDAPTQNLRRTLTRDVELHGRVMRTGEKAVLIFGSANRDERAIPDPDRFDIRRRFDGHLAFGHGAHFCLGAALARMEARIALEALYQRFDRLAPEESPVPERVHSANQRGFASLFVIAA